MDTAFAPSVPSTPSVSRSGPSPWALAAAGTLFSFLWASAFIAGKIGFTACGPLTLLSLRFTLVGGGLAIALALPRRGLRVSGRAVLAGLLSNAVYLGLAYSGMTHVPAALTAIIVCTTPLLVVALGAGLGRERLGARAGWGLALAFGAVVLIMGQRLHLDGLAPWAVGLIAAGTLALALGTRLNQGVAGREDPWQVACAQLLASGLVLLPLAWATEGLQVRWGWAFWGSLLYQAGPVSLGTTLILLWLVRQGGASRASSFHLLSPFFSIALAVGLLGERLYPLDLLGLLPLVAGMALVLRRPALPRP
ncbi:DMT family transporter [Ideonella dechloratans]|uniref:DMT family transporter n=1 Tax=Ideonella dechloratans TaxID=36863 RepID=UPI0035AFE869